MAPIGIHLVSYSGDEIKIHPLGEEDESNRHIRDLRGEPLSIRFACGEVIGAAVVDPSQHSEQLARLGRKQHGQVLRVMKLLPVPLLHELTQLVSDRSKWIFTGDVRHAASYHNRESQAPDKAVVKLSALRLESDL